MSTAIMLLKRAGSEGWAARGVVKGLTAAARGASKATRALGNAGASVGRAAGVGEDVGRVGGIALGAAATLKGGHLAKRKVDRKIMETKYRLGLL